MIVGTEPRAKKTTMADTQSYPRWGTIFAVLTGVSCFCAMTVVEPHCGGNPAFVTVMSDNIQKQDSDLDFAETIACFNVDGGLFLESDDTAYSTERCLSKNNRKVLDLDASTLDFNIDVCCDSANAVKWMVYVSGFLTLAMAAAFSMHKGWETTLSEGTAKNVATYGSVIGFVAVFAMMLATLLIIFTTFNEECMKDWIKDAQDPDEHDDPLPKTNDPSVMTRSTFFVMAAVFFSAMGVFARSMRVYDPAMAKAYSFSKM